MEASLGILDAILRQAGTSGAFLLEASGSEALKALGLRTVHAEPIELEGRLLGLLCLGFGRSRAFDEELRPAMAQVARMAAVLLRRIELESVVLEADLLRAELAVKRKLELESRERAEQASLALEAAGCGLLAYTFTPATEASRILWCNDIFQDLCGHSSAELLNSGPDALLVPDPREPCGRLEPGSSESGIHLDLLTKDGRRLPVEVYNVAARGRSWALSVVRDGTVQRRLAHELKDYKERLETFVQQRTATLQSQEALWRSCVQKSPNGILMIDDMCRVEEVNPEACRSLGLQKAGVLRRPLSELLAPEHRVAGLAAFGDAVRSGKSEFEGAFLNAEEGQLWWEVDFRKLADGRVVMYARDQTIRHLEEEAMRLHALAIEQAPHALSMAGMDGCLLDANQQFLRLWGYDQPGQVLGKPITRFLQEPDPVVGLLQELYQGDEWEGEVVGLRRDGQAFSAHGSARLLRNELGRPEQVVASFMDISERKSFEEELRRGEERYRKIVDGCPDALAVVSDGRWVFLNPAGAVLLGADQEEAYLGQPFLDSIHPHEWIKSRERLHRVAAEGQSVSFFKQRIVRRDGSVLPVEGSAVPTIFQGQLAVQLALREVVERN